MNKNGCFPKNGNQPQSHWNYSIIFDAIMIKSHSDIFSIAYKVAKLAEKF
jgi:hypothetical protein